MTFRLAIIPRTSARRGLVAITTVCLAALAAILIGGLLLAILGHSPLAVLKVFFIQPFTSLYSIVEVMNKTTTLAIIAIGLSVGFRSGVWNIGAEGQLLAGALLGSAIGLALGGHDRIWVLPLMLIGGCVGGILWAAIPAFLRATFRANEILVSLMLVYVAQLMLAYFVHGPLKDPAGFGFPQSKLLADDASLSIWLSGARLYATTLLLPIIAFAATIFFRRHYAFFQMRVVGMAPRAARFAGYSENRAVWMSFIFSGGLAGLMGIVEVAGPVGQLTPYISPGYGFTAIIVAFLGRLHPLAIVPAAMLMATTQIGGESAQIALKLPISVSGVFQGLVLFCLLASEFLIAYRVALRRDIKSL